VTIGTFAGRRPSLATMTRWLVDGMNVIGSRPDGWWRDRDGAMCRLVAELDRFAHATGEAVAVVFDGRPRTIEAERVEVRFAARRGPNAADDDIAALAAADDDPAGLRVVTSDAALAGRVKAAGASVVGGGAFRRMLDDAAQEDGGGGRSSAR
jgi:predicted RNA-binding protein with PIN domain